jgi:hypothetical protein
MKRARTKDAGKAADATVLDEPNDPDNRRREAAKLLGSQLSELSTTDGNRDRKDSYEHQGTRVGAVGAAGGVEPRTGKHDKHDKHDELVDDIDVDEDDDVNSTDRDFSIEAISRDALDYVHAALGEHLALVQRRAAARRKALNMTMCIRQANQVDGDEKFESVRYLRMPADTFLGDVRLRTVDALLREIDERGFERSNHQERFHNAFIRACSRVLYREEWAVHRTAIMSKNSWMSVQSEIMISTPRRFGKVRVSASTASLLQIGVHIFGHIWTLLQPVQASSASSFFCSRTHARAQKETAAF